MKCANCGYENPQYSEFCPHCGAALQADEVSLNPAADKVLPALKSGMFVTIAILMSITCILSLIVESLNVIGILFAVFLWLTYASAIKNFDDARHLRSLSGTVFAYYVINYVLCGLIIFLGILICIITAFISLDPSIINEMMSEISNEIAAEFSLLGAELVDLSAELLIAILWIASAVLILIGVAVILINALGFRKIHKFAQSVYKSVEMCESNFRYANAAKNWLIVFAVFTLLSAVSSLFADTEYCGIEAIISACEGVAMILSSVLIKKHFIKIDSITQF